MVDDDDLVVEVVRKLLAPLQCEVVGTTSSVKAKEILSKWEFAVLLCDLNMPEISGTELLASARKTNPDIVSVVITGFADHDATIRAINEGGIWKFITKPWKQEELIHTVKEGLHRYSTYHRSDAKLQSLARTVTHKTRSHPGGRSAPIVVVKKTPERRHAGIEKPVPSSRYTFESVIGEGGTGTVYKAHDTLLGMPVAVKVVSSRLAKDPIALASLKEEARIAMQLSHRHIVRLHNLQMSGEHYFLVMEYVEGRTFRQVIDACGPLPMETVAMIVKVANEALSYAHRHEVIHKDLKPENILLTDNGVLKIIDFGIAGPLNAQSLRGLIMGTPAYMSPEQIRNEHLDARSDVYSLGVIVYELLTGDTPLPKDLSAGAILKMGPMTLAGLSDPLISVLSKAVAFNRDDRWSTVSDFARAFARV